MCTFFFWPQFLVFSLPLQVKNKPHDWIAKTCVYSGTSWSKTLPLILKKISAQYQNWIAMLKQTQFSNLSKFWSHPLQLKKSDCIVLPKLVPWIKDAGCGHWGSGGVEVGGSSSEGDGRGWGCSSTYCTYLSRGQVAARGLGAAAYFRRE
jgi:hypothetical protein